MAISRKIRWLLIILGTLVVLIVAALAALHFAVRYEPSFYRDALKTDNAALEKGSDRMLQQTTALAGAVKKEGDWDVLFTATQINGWLAVDMVQNHPKLLPPGLSDPRVEISSKGIILGCRYEKNGLKTVLSLTIEPYLPKPNVLALRFVNARMGMLPAPLGDVLQWFTQTARDMRWQIIWRQAGNDPVAILVPPPDEKHPLELKKIHLGDGEIFFSGSTTAKKP